ncbi:SulP family inorganic anion transporter [Aquimarina sp. 2201CG5-10]|uniref:SulP family inorganic anion transporter n=1 Tax=Aquimarina callyspongiae TaxID=3098150 RepID=UPI002AB4A1AD|nr:SulP family inorganic anion transporter [Aquimarina sp. 2201CG5-10]MDY8135304.1 SulP family inorganic anion transporter [Aquimarina sp. 2201CG5-10]
MKENKNNVSLFISTLPKNIFSGFVVSLIALPLGLGLALASEAPPIAGVIAAIVGGVIVSIFGGSNVTIAGPGNGLVVVLLGAITTLGNGDLYLGYLFTLAAIICAGVLMILIGILRLGTLSDFFPSSAIQGMLAAIGISIFAKQFHVMIANTGIKGDTVSLLSDIPTSIISLYSSFDKSVLIAAIVGIISLLIMVFYGKIRNKYLQLIPAPMWIVLLTVGLSYYYEFFSTDSYPIQEKLLVQIPDKVFSGFPSPDFSMIFQVKFIGVVLAITLISSIESLLSIKAVDKLDPEKRRSNVNRDLTALGVASIVSGFIGGLNVVTVIARSSVNVNNGGSNRSANFFHAVFLVLFVVLFQDQLSRIPLTALAAILVYTGYKLAAPRNLKDVAKIGREQVFIFAATIIATIVTNLITGILVGILTTVLIHFILNKSVMLFARNLIKPNVLMFKEEINGNYFVSVKNFSSFLNYNKLRKKIDTIPESSDAVVDFSLCDFVDYTVQENLIGYQESFKRKGGSLEIIGLDIHKTSSEHPMAIRSLISFSKKSKSSTSLTKRQEGLKMIASDFGWNYNATKDTNCIDLNDFVFFKTKKTSYLHNTIYNNRCSFKISDIEYSEGEFIARKIIRATVLTIKLNTEIPKFTLDREGLLEFIYKFAGFKDIPIEDHPDFSKRFFLLGENPDNIRLFFTDELVLFFESNPYYHIECNGNNLLLMQKERLASIKEVKALLDYGIRLEKIISGIQYGEILLKSLKIKS